MRSSVLHFFCLGLAASVGVLGCNSAAPAGGAVGGDEQKTGGTPPPAATAAPVPEFPSGSGQMEHTIAYPAAPYGSHVGSTVPNYQFVGYANPAVTNKTFQAIEFADFYNPHADVTSYAPADAASDDRLFPAGSQYNPGCKADTDCPFGLDGKTHVTCDTAHSLCVGTPKPKALGIVVASVWCGPCNEEANSVSPAAHKYFRPIGGEFFLNLADGPTPGISATTKSLYNWTAKYGDNFPAVIDPAYKLGALFAEPAFPANMIIDTRCMRIVDSQVGGPFADPANPAFDPTFPYWVEFAGVIKKSTCPK